VTEIGLQLAQLWDGCVKFLSKHMPSAQDEIGADDQINGQAGLKLDYEKWLDKAFQEQ
jgi:hypothetical protein